MITLYYFSELFKNLKKRKNIVEYITLQIIPIFPNYILESQITQ